MSIKITAISDTHNWHKKIQFRVGGDILIHAGDHSSRGTEEECIQFMKWLKRQPFTHKVFIAGNHDFAWEDPNLAPKLEQIAKDSGLIYLNDTSVTIENVKIHGSPVQPWFHNWAFNRVGELIKPHWDLIPSDTKILITHGPPLNILDKTLRGPNVGCPYLLDKVKEVKPKLHIFGHIHEAAGYQTVDETTFANVSFCGIPYSNFNRSVFGTEID